MESSSDEFITRLYWHLNLMHYYFGAAQQLKKTKKQCKFQNISSKWKHIVVSELMTDHSLSACQTDLHVISLLSRKNNYDIKDLSLLIFHSDGTVSSNGVQTAVWRSSYGECLSVSGLLVVIRCLEDRLNSRLHQSTSAFLQL